MKKKLSHFSGLSVIPNSNPNLTPYGMQVFARYAMFGFFRCTPQAKTYPYSGVVFSTWKITDKKSNYKVTDLNKVSIHSLSVLGFRFWVRVGDFNKQWKQLSHFSGLSVIPNSNPNLTSYGMQVFARYAMFGFFRCTPQAKTYPYSGVVFSTWKITDKKSNYKSLIWIRWAFTRCRFSDFDYGCGWGLQ